MQTEEESHCWPELRGHHERREQHHTGTEASMRIEEEARDLEGKDTNSRIGFKIPFHDKGSRASILEICT